MLVAPLNWGIGHATRMVPIIRQLLLLDFKVLLGSDGAALQVLQQEFPQLPFVVLPSYNIHYSKDANFMKTIALQLPKIGKAAYDEHKLLKKIVIEHKIDALISDSRIGLHHSQIPSVFVAHQLFIQMPKGKKWLESPLGRLNLQLIENFNQCWIPDYKNRPNLSGKLSHAKPLAEEKFRFIGPLSRLTKVEAIEEDTDLLILLSGPEPQRTLLEEKIIEELKGFKGKVIFTRGRTDGDKTRKKSKNRNIIWHDYLDAKGVAESIARSKMIVCRSGYSTIMDLVTIIANTNKKVVLIPTPGQTEQEYLARYFEKQGIFYAVSQKKFRLKKVLTDAKKQKGWIINNDLNKDNEEKVSLLEKVLTDWKQQLWKH